MLTDSKAGSLVEDNTSNDVPESLRLTQDKSSENPFSIDKILRLPTSSATREAFPQDLLQVRISQERGPRNVFCPRVSDVCEENWTEEQRKGILEEGGCSALDLFQDFAKAPSVSSLSSDQMVRALSTFPKFAIITHSISRTHIKTSRNTLKIILNCDERLLNNSTTLPDL